jgi:hypothetical protein
LFRISSYFRRALILPQAMNVAPNKKKTAHAQKLEVSRHINNDKITMKVPRASS